MSMVLQSLMTTLKSCGVGTHYLVENPATGNPQFASPHSDVWGAIEALGGIDAASTKLNVNVAEVNRWLDDHFIPTPHAEKIYLLTGRTKSLLQEPPFYVFDGERFWPHVPQRKRLRSVATDAIIFPAPAWLWSGLLPRTKYRRLARQLAS